MLMKCGRNSEVLGLQDQKEKCDVKIVSAGSKRTKENKERNARNAIHGTDEMRDVKFADTKGKR